MWHPPWCLVELVCNIHLRLPVSLETNKLMHWSALGPIA
jgi:hypothetical protein